MATPRPEVLIVDGQPRNLDALEDTLAPLDCVVVRAATAGEALSSLARHDFAAIVLDIQMPGMSGTELAKAIKQMDGAQSVPILFLTPHLMDDRDVLEGYDAGGVDCLSQPIHPDILRSKVGVFVELFRKTRMLAQGNEALQREVAEREQAQEALETVNAELERRVREGTAALTRARDETERQGRLQDEFLATLSHELRTPMNAILGWLAILESGKPLRDVYSALAVIRRNAEIQARLIDDLLDMNRLLSGNFTLQLSDVDVAVMLEMAMQALGPAAERKRVQLRATADLVGTIRADGRRLQQVLWNLAHNAIKFTPSGGLVELRLSRVADAIHISVTDNGRGISAQFLPYVFDRFRLQDASTTRESSGLGLGLSISKHLVELHGGTIEAFSAGLGQGATFVVRLPEVLASVVADCEHASAQRAAPCSLSTDFGYTAPTSTKSGGARTVTVRN